ncbi:MAG: MEMO1 family protein [Methanobacteriota archaeon]|nr:MAG: MEMO1 family protein [Euryarchaeota archaeon]
MRYPAVAGQFYSSDPEKLRKQIENCYMSPIGPGELPVLKEGPRSIVGAVSPHAGFVYSGPVAAHVFLALAKDGFPKTFIVIGPNHSGMGSMVSVTTEDFSMPTGVVQVDTEIAGSICRGMISEDNTAHRFEHSLEVQLPFIQQISSDVRIVPVCMGMQDFDTAKEVGEIIGEETQGKDVVIIASTDFSHYVPQDTATKMDRMAIDKILELDPKGLSEVVSKKRISMCGYGPVMAMLFAGQGSKSELLKYSTSGEVSPMREVVGYAGMIVRK